MDLTAPELNTEFRCPLFFSETGHNITLNKPNAYLREIQQERLILPPSVSYGEIIIQYQQSDRLDINWM